MPPLVIIGEALGENEARLGAPFVGPSGIELIRMLGEARVIDLTPIDRDYISRYYHTQDPAQVGAIWALHPEVARTNVFDHHPPGNDIEFFCGPKSDAVPGWPALSGSKFVTVEWAGELARLEAELLAWKPNVIVALGNTPLWALTGRTGITKLRGSVFVADRLVPGTKVIPTYHPAFILRQWKHRPVAIANLMKAATESHHPELRRPEREIWIEPSLSDIEDFVRGFIPSGCLLSVDIETAGDRVTCIGFAPSPSRAIVIPFDDDRQPSRSYWHSPGDERKCWEIVRRVLGDASIHKLFQNGLYDIAFLWRSMRIKVIGAREDTMLLHHALQPESLKDLGFLGSTYTEERSWKGMRKRTETIKRDA